MLNLLNLLGSFFNQSQNNPSLHQNTNSQNEFNQSSQRVTSDYPEPIFTNSYKQNFQQNNFNQSSTQGNFQQSPSQNSFNQNSSMLGNFLNADMLKTILPLLTNKGSKNDFSNILQKLNPQMSNIMSIFNKKDIDKKNETKDNLVQTIDLKDYTEVV